MTKITEQTKTILNCFNNSRLNINNITNFGVWSKLKQIDFLRPLWWHNAGEDDSKTSRFNKKKRKKNFLLFLSLLFLRCNPKREINYFYFCFPPFNQHLLLNRLLQTIWHTNDVTIRVVMIVMRRRTKMREVMKSKRRTSRMGRLLSEEDLIFFLIFVWKFNNCSSLSRSLFSCFFESNKITQTLIDQKN